jgi:hypothetical protein
VLSASGFRTLMRDVPSIQDKVLAAHTARHGFPTTRAGETRAGQGRREAAYQEIRG